MFFERLLNRRVFDSVCQIIARGFNGERRSLRLIRPINLINSRNLNRGASSNQHARQKFI